MAKLVCVLSERERERARENKKTATFDVMDSRPLKKSSIRGDKVFIVQTLELISGLLSFLPPPELNRYQVLCPGLSYRQSPETTSGWCRVAASTDLLCSVHNSCTLGRPSAFWTLNHSLLDIVYRPMASQISKNGEHWFPVAKVAAGIHRLHSIIPLTTDWELKMYSWKVMDSVFICIQDPQFFKVGSLITHLLQPSHWHTLKSLSTSLCDMILIPSLDTSISTSLLLSVMLLLSLNLKSSHSSTSVLYKTVLWKMFKICVFLQVEKRFLSHRKLINKCNGFNDVVI